jgi:ABC-type transport system involved in multi-copper enzyme maturation permease subunit
MNPLLWLELRIRVRERRLWVIAGFFVLMLALIAGLTMAVTIVTGRYNDEVSPATLGQTLTWATLYCQAGLLLILAPLSAACRLSQEREQRTLPALINSPLAPARIAWGKLLGAWAFTLWLGVLALPFLALADLWGGMDAGTIWLGFAFNLCMGMTLSALALGLSGLFGRSLTAYLATGALLFLWVAALPLIGGLAVSLAEHGADKLPRVIGYGFWYHNPIYPVLALCMRENGASMPDGWWSVIYALAVWTLLALGGMGLAIRGLKREVY